MKKTVKKKPIEKKSIENKQVIRRAEPLAAAEPVRQIAVPVQAEERQVINDRLVSGQLDACDLTLRDLDGIRQAFASAYMDTDLLLPASAIGLITGLGQFAAMGTPLLNPRLARRWGEGGTLVAAALGIGVSMLPLALLPHWLAVAVGSVGVLSMSAMWMPALHVFQMDQVESHWRSLAYGAVSMAMGFSFASMSLLGGYVICMVNIVFYV